MEEGAALGPRWPRTTRHVRLTVEFSPLVLDKAAHRQDPVSLGTIPSTQLGRADAQLLTVELTAQPRAGAIQILYGGLKSGIALAADGDAPGAAFVGLHHCQLTSGVSGAGPQRAPAAFDGGPGDASESPTLARRDPAHVVQHRARARGAHQPGGEARLILQCPQRLPERTEARPSDFLLDLGRAVTAEDELMLHLGTGDLGRPETLPELLGGRIVRCGDRLSDCGPGRRVASLRQRSHGQRNLHGRPGWTGLPTADPNRAGRRTVSIQLDQGEADGAVRPLFELAEILVRDEIRRSNGCCGLARR